MTKLEFELDDICTHFEMVLKTYNIIIDSVDSDCSLSTPEYDSHFVSRMKDEYLPALHLVYVNLYDVWKLIENAGA